MIMCHIKCQGYQKSSAPSLPSRAGDKMTQREDAFANMTVAANYRH